MAEGTHFSRTFTPLYDSYGISTLLNSNLYERVVENSPAGSSSRAEPCRVSSRMRHAVGGVRAHLHKVVRVAAVEEELDGA